MLAVFKLGTIGCGPGCGCTGDCRWQCGVAVAIADPTGGGDTAQAMATVGTGGVITALTLLWPGSTYSVAHPAVSLVAGFGFPGSGATATATVGEVVSLGLGAGGTGYTSAPTVTIAAPGGGGATATATATIDGAGHVTALTLVSKGNLYTTASPTVTISGGGGTGATATATAVPGQVTTLALTAGGTLYIDPSPPASLDFTISCPAWSYSMVLIKGDVTNTSTGQQPGTATGFTLVTSPPGGQRYCLYSNTRLVDLPATGVCGGITGVTLSAIVANTVSNGWCLMVDFTVGADPASTFPCPGAVYSDPLPCVKLSTGYPGGYPWPHGPGGPIGTTCPSRPFAWTAHVRTGINDRAYPLGEEGWYAMAGGTCPPPGTPYPNIFIDMALSEP